MVGGVGHAGATPAPPFALPPSLPPAVPLHTQPLVLFCFDEFVEIKMADYVLGLGMCISSVYFFTVCVTFIWLFFI